MYPSPHPRRGPHLEASLADLLFPAILALTLTILVTTLQRSTFREILFGIIGCVFGYLAGEVLNGMRGRGSGPP